MYFFNCKTYSFIVPPPLPKPIGHDLKKLHLFLLSGSSEEILKTAINTMHRSRGWIPLQNSNFFRIQMKNEITKHASDPIPPPFSGKLK